MGHSLDEVGFNEISPLEAKLFFQLIDLRYTKRSTIFTGNMSFEKWPKILGQDEMITKAILDRILPFSYLFNITGPSYRIKVRNLKCTLLRNINLTFIS